MKTVIEMALQAGIFHEYDSEGHWDGLTNEALVGTDYMNDKEHKLKRIAEILTPFAELVRADEREACAKVIDEMAEDMEREMEPSTAIAYVRSKAAVIRARGETK